ncbi:hypothetical protein H0H81_001775 [Sphagnurus paluster]|uniref:FAD dependent oxidoreductase domain-containing protein n=1 Tax=Sphagnurus paluster TaxID=117069 RepID=A0A9P7FQR0_9AGAR|nr:hypothetical protein H0H81_001775 [Sphagnurus paluster]
MTPVGSPSIFGALLYRLRNLTIRVVLSILRLFYPSLNELLLRLHRSPGLPVASPCPSYWLIPPSPIAKHGSGRDTELPAYADIVIIGSGITGTSVARTLLDWQRAHPTDGASPLHVVMLEARDTCSGATGRNGGHITPPTYPIYGELKAKYGQTVAQQIMRFRLAHVAQLREAAAAEGLLADSQCREVETFDVFHDARLYAESKARLAVYHADLPVEVARYKIHEGELAIKNMQDLQLSDRAVGCFSMQAGAVQPYRLVTGILARLLSEYTSHFHLFTQTPCTEILSPEPDAPRQLYRVTTPRGVIETPHVVHATNGWAGHLLPGMRGRIMPVRATMTAQRPQEGLGVVPSAPSDEAMVGEGAPPERSWAGMRSFTLFPGREVYNFDYLTQQLPAGGAPVSRYPPTEGEMMLGGGVAQGGVETMVNALGISDDGEWDAKTGDYLKHALQDYFDPGETGEVAGQKQEEEEGSDGHVKAVWSGILGLSADMKPWVGRVPSVASERRTPDMAGSTTSRRTAAPGEWMAAGYSGEGMVHAWLSGKALAYMVLGLDEQDSGEEKSTEEDLNAWFPDVFRVSERRWGRAGIEEFISHLYYETDTALQSHWRSKVHKRRCKELKQPAYTIEEAERAAGLGKEGKRATTIFRPLVAPEDAMV